MPRFLTLIFATALALLGGCQTSNLQVVRLNADNWDRYVPGGKEVDAIYGDWAISNEHLKVVIGDTNPGRNANMTVKEVAGCIIDLTRRQDENDQLSAYYPGMRKFVFRSSRANADPKGRWVEVICQSSAEPGKATHEVIYRLEAGASHVLITSVYRNPTDKPLVIDLMDDMRADKTFTVGAAGDSAVWAEDHWFNQAYGVTSREYAVSINNAKQVKFTRTKAAGGTGSSTTTLAAGEENSLTRILIPASNAIEVQATVKRLNGAGLADMQLVAADGKGPVGFASVTIHRDGQAIGRGRTDASGRLVLPLSPGKYQAMVQSIGRPPVTRNFEAGPAGRVEVKMEQPGWVRARITDESGADIPCKVQIIGVGGTLSPHFFHETGDFAVHNLRLTADGRFTQALAPGGYEALISRGPEFHAERVPFTVTRGQVTQLNAKIRRAFATPGWISADFHSHSSPSGDNTSSQLGRVLTHLTEHIEFAPCTEHNRIDSYAPHLKRLNAAHLLATCTGIELTGSPLPVNHHNAFPLIHKPRTQDGGAPLTDKDPAVQIERLALWDNGSHKLVQQNHPNIVELFFDKNLDGKADGGHAKGLPFMDVIEVHPLQLIFDGQEAVSYGRKRHNPIFGWMQMLNLGMNVPGVVNSDAHTNHHDLGYLRNYVQSPTDDPAKIATLDIVRASEKGRIIMTTGPYLETRLLIAGAHPAQVGDVAVPTGGKADLKVKVQCANWMDINRVQIFVNGRPDPTLNFTRQSHKDWFGDGVVKFDRVIPIELKTDAHLIVVAIGEGMKLRPVMGPLWGGENPPIAVANPIFVDVDGNGFKPNGDLLGGVLPGVEDGKK